MNDSFEQYFDKILIVQSIHRFPAHIFNFDYPVLLSCKHYLTSVCVTVCVSDKSYFCFQVPCSIPFHYSVKKYLAKCCILFSPVFTSKKFFLVYIIEFYFVLKAFQVIELKYEIVLNSHHY